MTFSAGELDRLIRIEERGGGQDAIGQPSGPWSLVGEIWAGIANETGLGAIRSSAQGNLQASIARYSFKVRFAEARELGIDAGMRILHDDAVFDVRGVTRDYQDRDAAFIICEQGGNDG